MRTRTVAGLGVLLGLAVTWAGYAADAPPTTRTSNDEAGWSETLNGLRVRLTAPGGTTYREKALLPLRVEVQNHGGRPVPYADIWLTVRVWAHDGDGRWLGISQMGPQMGDWATRSGSLAPGQIIEQKFTFQSLRFNRPLKVDETIQLQVSAPTQQQRPGTLPLEVNSPALPVRLGSAFPQPLAAADVAGDWHMDLACSLEVPLIGSQTLNVDARGLATLAQDTQRNGERVHRRLSVALPADRLGELAAALRKMKVWKLGGVGSEIVGPDEGSIRLALVTPSGGSVVGVFPSRVESQNLIVRDLRQLIEGLIADVESLAAAAQSRRPPGAAESHR